MDAGRVDPASVAEFVAHRPMLFGLAYRLLGSVHDADDVLQEAYLRWAGRDRSAVRAPRRYLTRVVARLAIDRVRARQALRESYVGEWLPEPVATDPSPFGEADLSDLSLAVLHLMEYLTPPQRATYVLRAAFGLPYEEIAPIVDHPPDHCRQLFRRAAKALRSGRPRYPPDRGAHRRLLDEFLAAARGGDRARLERLLRSDVVVWSDGGGRAKAARQPITTPAKVARFFAGIYSRPAFLQAVPVELNGAPAAVMEGSRGRHVLVVIPGPAGPGLAGPGPGAISRIYLVSNPQKLSGAAAAADRTRGQELPG